MGPLGRAQITFTLAARAAGVTEKQLRNWLDKAQVPLQGDDERSEGQWRRFSLIDVVRLAVVGSLVRYGIPIVTAADLVGDSVDLRLADFADFEGAHVEGLRPTSPRRAIQGALRGMIIVVSNGGGTEDDNQLHYRFGFNPVAKPALTPRGFDTRNWPKPDTSDLRHFVQIDVGQVAQDALARLDADSEEEN